MAHHTALDTVLTIGMAAAGAIAPLVLADATTTAQELNELKLLLLPFVGAVVTSGGLILLNPQQETRKIVVGRAIFALLAGVLGPQVLALFHPALAEMVVKPAALMALGCMLSFLGYLLSKPFCREMYARADRVAQREADRLEGKFSPEKNEDR